MQNFCNESVQSLKNVSDEEKLSEILDDPVAFGEYFCDLNFFDYQERILLDPNPRISIRTGRQVGKTTVLAVKALHKAFTNPEQQILIIAKSWRQSAIMFSRIRNLIHRNSWIESQIKKETATMIYFLNGSEIYCLPAGYSGDTIRGYSPDLIIVDEAAFVPDEVFLAIEPSIAVTQGEIVYSSTPFGKRGVFYQCFISSGWSCHHVKSSECPIIPKDFLQRESESKTKNEYLQEYEGEFLSDADNYFPRDLVFSVTKDYAESSEPLKNREYFLGVDVARMGKDETVYSIVEYDGVKCKLVRLIATQKLPTTDIVGRVKRLHEKWDFSLILIDETGVGGGPADQLKEANVPIKLVTFSVNTKNEMYPNLKFMMEHNLLEIYQNQKLEAQLTDLGYSHTSGGKFKFSHSERGHDDYPDSLALACYALMQPRGRMEMLEDPENVLGLR